MSVLFCLSHAQVSAELTTLVNLNAVNSPAASLPNGGLTLGSDGNLYGTTRTGGTNDLGTVFRLSPAGTFTTLYSFAGSDGSFPCGTLTPTSNGRFVGATQVGGSSDVRKGVRSYYRRPAAPGGSLSPTLASHVRGIG